MSAVHHLANLAAVDKENKFEKIFDRYYGLLDDTSVFVAIYVAQASGKIAKAKPESVAKITRSLLGVEKVHHQGSRKELIKAGIIESFGEYYEKYPGKSAILGFVRQQVNSRSGKTKKLAKAFLKRWEK
jgi:hypothetical protein